MSMPDATETAPQNSDDEYAELNACLSDKNGDCQHERYSQLAQDLPFVTEGIEDVSEAREHIDNAYRNDEIAVINDEEYGRPDTKIHKPSCTLLNHSTSDENGSHERSEDTSKDDQNVVEPPEDEKTEYTRTLERRVEDLEDTVEDLMDVVDSYEDQVEQVTHGLTELQANQLARGGLISTKGADVDRLNSLDVDGLDFNVSVAGNRDVIRADETKIGESRTAVNELPNFEELIDLEADRQRLRYDIYSRDDIDTAVRRRAVEVWQDIHVLNSNDRDRVIIEHDDLREKVSSILDREGNPQEGETLSQTTRRVRQKLAELSGDVLHLDKGTNPHRLIGRREDVKAARLEDGTIARDDEGDAIVLNGGK